MTAIQLRTELFREMSPLLDNELAMKKMLTFIRTLSLAKPAKAESGWADRFVGAWKEDRSADEIVSDIRSARTANAQIANLTIVTHNVKHFNHIEGLKIEDWIDNV